MSSLSGQKEVEYLQPPMMDQTEKKRDKMEGEAERQGMLPAPVCLEVCLRTRVFTELLLLSDLWGGFILHSSHITSPARQSHIWGGSKLAFLAS